MAATQLILLERVPKLGAMGEVVSVRPGYARNYLLPQRKALRATEANRAYFEAQREALEAVNAERRAEAEKRGAGLDGLTISIVRQASERGHLYGSVTARDIAAALAEEGGKPIARSAVELKSNIRAIGLFPVEIALHPEVTITVTVNVARTPAEAELQAKTGKPAITLEEEAQEEAPAAEEAAEAPVAPEGESEEPTESPSENANAAPAESEDKAK